jgi:hypothetical protein
MGFLANLILSIEYKEEDPNRFFKGPKIFSIPYRKCIYFFIFFSFTNFRALHQLTPEAFIKVGVFIWDMSSQGIEPDARCFCNIHELSY